MILKEVKIEWVHITNATNKYNSDDKEYTVSALLNKEQAQEFVDGKMSKALKPHKDLADTYVQKFTVNVLKKDGTPMTKPFLVNSYGKPVEGLVGNGSVGSIQYRTFEWDNKFGTGVKAILQGVMVTDLVEYGSTGGTPEMDFLASVEGVSDLDDVDLSSDF